MKNILLVFTGGTIGSRAEAGTITPSDQARYTLIALFEQHPAARAVRFDCLQPLQLLSENLQPPMWTTLIAAIEQQNLTDYDGIIVTHGTDTLAFTAAALSFYFHRLPKPLLLVSSNYPLEHPQANGLQNFVCAVEFIRQQKQNGVFVPYTNPGQATQVHLGSRLAASLQLSSDFFSVKSSSYLTFQDDVFHYVEKPLAVLNPYPIDLKADFSKRILLIKPYPGLDYTQFNLHGVDAVLHDLYHSGTACTLSAGGEQHNLLAFLQRCKHAGVGCYLAPALKTADLYASSRAFLAEGACVIWNMSLEAAYVKLLFALDNFAHPALIKAFIEQDITLEHIAG